MPNGTWLMLIFTTALSVISILFNRWVNNIERQNEKDHEEMQRNIAKLQEADRATNDKIHSVKEVVLEEIGDIKIDIAQFLRDVKTNK